MTNLWNCQQRQEKKNYDLIQETVQDILKSKKEHIQNHQPYIILFSSLVTADLTKILKTYRLY